MKWSPPPRLVSWWPQTSQWDYMCYCIRATVCRSSEENKWAGMSNREEIANKKKGKERATEEKRDNLSENIRICHFKKENEVNCRWTRTQQKNKKQCNLALKKMTVGCSLKVDNATDHHPRSDATTVQRSLINSPAMYYYTVKRLSFRFDGQKKYTSILCS